MMQTLCLQSKSEMKFYNLLEEKFPFKVEHHNETNSLKLCSKWKSMGSFEPTTAAAAIGFWHLLTHLFGFILFISAFYLTPDYCHLSSYGNQVDVQIITRSDSLLDSKPHIKNNTSDVKLWLFVSLLSFTAIVCMICGIFKRRSVLIVPFLIFQCLDVLFDTSVLFVYVSQSSSINEFFHQLRQPPFQQFLVRYGSHHKMMFAFLYLTISFSVKIYFIRVVYSSYKVTNVMERFKSRRVPSMLILPKS